MTLQMRRHVIASEHRLSSARGSKQVTHAQYMAQRRAQNFSVTHHPQSVRESPRIPLVQPPCAASTNSEISSETVTVDDFTVDSRPVILFDGVCNLCNTAVNIMLDIDTEGAFRLAALQSPAGRRLLQRAGRRPDDISSIILIDRNGAYIRSEAVLRIVGGLGSDSPAAGPLFAVLSAAGLLFPSGFRDGVYDLVADNRYTLMGKRPGESCRMNSDGFSERFMEV